MKLLCRFLPWLAFLLPGLGQGIPEPPAVPREFRGMWIASVANIDWPSRSGLSTARQQAELRNLLDGAKKLNLNVVILQVRPSADAFYESALEPWSEYLTGTMGRAPNPRWDPLKFACDEAHARGLELHAWINPFRARHTKALSQAAPGHLTRARPEWVLPYVRFLWLDPGIPEVREHSLKVATDIVRRYDVDGLHIDDYFYPYPEQHPDTLLWVEFPDDASYARYRQRGGRLPRVDWRRDNVNRFVEGLHAAVHKEKPWVKVGISPFGIWRPNHPPGIKGLDQYGLLYADARLWLHNGWADYFAPQLYWPLSRRDQSFPALLRWWSEQNRRQRLLVPGLSSASIGKDRQAVDIANQVRIARQQQAAGVLFWSAASLRDNKGGVADGLTVELFKQPALPPAVPWLGTNAPATPDLTAELLVNNTVLKLGWQATDTNQPTRQFLLQTRVARQWHTEILGPRETNRVYDLRRRQVIPDEVRVLGVGRTGAESEPATWLKPPPEKRP